MLDCSVLIQIFRPGSAVKDVFVPVYSREVVKHEGGLHSQQKILAAGLPSFV